MGDRATAQTHFTRLVALARAADTERPELSHARAFLGTLSEGGLPRQ